MGNGWRMEDGTRQRGWPWPASAARKSLAGNDPAAVRNAITFLAGGLYRNTSDDQPEQTMRSIAEIMARSDRMSVQERADWAFLPSVLANYGPAARPYVKSMIDQARQQSIGVMSLAKVGGEQAVAYLVGACRVWRRQVEGFGRAQEHDGGHLGAPAAKVRVLTGNVGGSFGMKAASYPEYVCILHGARALGRPVKWTDERSGSFVSDHHGRDYDMTVEVAFDQDGLILAMRLTGYGNLGGYCAAFGPLLPTVNVTKNIVSMYRTPLLEVTTQCVFSNTTLVSAYRGAGRPEGALSMERTMDYAAAELGIDRFELRRRNFIKAREMPFKSASGMVYDCGDFPGLFKDALAQADVKGFKQRKRESKRAGKLRGLGVACYVETTAAMTTEQGAIRFNADDTVTIVTGTLDYGQGHASAFAQVLTEKLGVPFDRIRLVQGDSDQLVTGGGTGGSRSAMLSGTAIAQASEKVIAIGKQIAAHALEASAGDIEFKHGRFIVAGTDHSIDIMALAQRLRSGMTLPSGMPASLDVTHVTGSRARHLSERSSCRRSGNRSRHRLDPHGEIHRGQRFRHRHQSDAGGRRDPGRRRAGARSGAAGRRGLRCRRPIGHRLVHGLRHAARTRCADDRRRQSPGADQEQSDRRQGLRRGGHFRRPTRGSQRGDRRAVGLRHKASGNADDAGPHLAGDRGSQGQENRLKQARRRHRPAPRT